METKTYFVPNISCKHCTHTITMELSEIQGVKTIETDLHAKQVTVSFEPPATEEIIKRTMAEIHYPVAN